MNETVTQIYVQVVGGPAQEKKLLDSSLTIGSDGTDIIIDHPHISPLHCTLFNRSGIISIIDHNSDYGVAINDKRIAPNKMIMLMKNDRIQCGELEIKFFVDTLHAQSTNSLIEEDDNTLILNRNSDGTLTSLRAANETKTKINENLESDDEIQITSTQIVPAGFVPPGSTNADSLVQFMNEHDEKENAKVKTTEEDEKTQVWSPMKNSNTTTGKIELDTEEEPIQQPTKSSAILKIDTDELDQSKENTTQQNTEPTNTRTNTVNELKPEKEMELSKASIKIGNKIQGSKPATNFQSQKLLKPSRRRWSSFVDFNSMTFPVRMAAFLIDVILSVKLVQFLIQENMLDEIQLVQSFSFFGIDFFLEQTKIHFDPTYAQSVLGPYVAAFLIIRVISSFIFGVTIGQVLCGVQSEGNIFFKRIFAVVREILGILTGPFLIFDLPALFAKKTIKEILSLSKLYQLDRSSYVLMLIMPPIIFALCYLGPMLEGESHFQKIAMDLKTEVVSAKTGSTNPDEIAPRLVNVNFLQTQFPVGNQERTLAMGLQKTYLENVTRPFPSMKILFLNPSLVVNWQKIKNIDLGTILARAVNEKNGWL
ncbi:MAG: FHA domain-containing protein, partial [Bacteriovoracaceae bacterium]|nr:FHA domain-containing protein [Bacteriovoracaceae bacterium]